MPPGRETQSRGPKRPSQVLMCGGRLSLDSSNGSKCWRKQHFGAQYTCKEVSFKEIPKYQSTHFVQVSQIANSKSYRACLRCLRVRYQSPRPGNMVNNAMPSRVGV